MTRLSKRNLRQIVADYRAGRRHLPYVDKVGRPLARTGTLKLRLA